MTSKNMTENEARSLLAQVGVPFVRQRRETEAAAVLEAAKESGYPIVLKGIADQVFHKTEAGLVKIGLNDPDQVTAAMEDMRRAGADDFLVQPMVRGNRELVAGMFRDRQFGPVILFGLGGILTEALNDVVFKIAPVSETDIDDMFDQIKSQKLLGAFRGEKPVDRQAVGDILKALSDTALADPQIQEIDLNPVIIQPDGTPVAVDALVIKGEPQPEAPPAFKVDLEQLFRCYYPKTVAFIGASVTIGKWGHMLMVNTLSQDFKGRVFLVNPKGENIAGRPSVKSIADIDEDIDLAVVTIPAAHVTGLIPELAQKNTKGMLVITSGFREIGPDGIALEKDLVEKAGKAGILILGPNTMGISNPHADFHCCAAHSYPRPGSTALVCQSGNMGAQILVFADQQDIGIRAFSGSGNEAMVTIEDYMEAFEVDELTRTVVLYLESVKDGKRFFRSAARVSKKKPVVVLKGGRTPKGGQAALSHTGAMASDVRVFDAACRQAGIIQVRQPMELLDLSAVFSSLPLPKGSRVAIMTLGGGWGVITTDLCAEMGLDVPQLSPKIIETLNQILPPFWSHGNPVDIVGERDPEIPKRCLEALLQWDGCDAVIHLGIHGRRVMVDRLMDSAAGIDPDLDGKTVNFYKDAMNDFEEDYVRYVAQLTQTYQKPVLGVSLLTDESSRTVYRVNDIDYKSVFFPTPERAVKALWGMVQYEKWLRSHKTDDNS